MAEKFPRYHGKQLCPETMLAQHHPTQSHG